MPIVLLIDDEVTNGTVFEIKNILGESISEIRRRISVRAPICEVENLDGDPNEKNKLILELFEVIKQSGAKFRIYEIPWKGTYDSAPDLGLWQISEEVFLNTCRETG